MGWWVTTSVLRQLGGEPTVAAAQMARIAGGDLSPSHNMQVAPESLLGKLEYMRANLAKMINNLHANGVSLTTVSVGLNQQASTISTASAVQGTAISNMAAAIEEMAVSIAQITDNATTAQQNARNAEAMSNAGVETIQTASEEMKNIAQAVQTAANEMGNLQQKTGEITNIVSVIQEIAEQTNLLALNAAIEAARAGEQDRGFAVVADEVRQLAERTAISTQEINTMISYIHVQTESVMQAMLTGKSRADCGMIRAQEAASVIEKIKNGNATVLLAVGEISSALMEQKTTTEDMAQRVEDVNLQTENNINVVKTLTNSVAKLQEITTYLQADALKFKLS